MASTSPAPIDYRTYSTILDQAERLMRKSGKALTCQAALHALMEAYPTDARYADAARRYGRQTARSRPAVTKAAPAQTVRKAEASPTPAFDDIRVQGDALFRTGQAGSTWEGMGMVAAAQPALYTAYVAERRAAAHLPGTSLTKAADAGPAARPPLPTPVASPPPPSATPRQEPPQPSLSATDTLMQTVATRQAAEPGLSFVAALDAVHKEAPTLYDAYQAESRYPHLRGQPLTKQEAPAPPTYEAIVAMADARVAKAAGLSRRDALMALAQEHPGEQAYYEAYRKYHLTAGLQEHHAAHVAQRQARS